MLDGLSVEQLDRWHEAYATGNIDDSWQQTAMIACEIRNLPQRVRYWVLGGDLKEDELATPGEFLPNPIKRKRRKRDGGRAFEKKLAQRFKR